MPSHYHRRKVRALKARSFITKPIFLNNVMGETEVVQIQNYFTYVTETMAQQNSVANTVSVLQGIIDQVNSRVEFFRVLDILEEQVLSILGNISDGITPGIIKMRMECVRMTIMELPEGPEYGTGGIRDMLFHILDLITNGMSLSSIAENVIQLQKYTLELYNQNELLTQIQTTIIDIICNISQGTPSGIIACRIDYLRSLIAKLQLIEN
jgi:hypothetical protein